MWWSEVAILTRRSEDNVALADELHARGVTVIELPCIRTEALSDARPLDEAIASLRPADLLVLTSRAGVDAVASLGTDVPCPVAAVGPATADSARDAGLSVTFVASRANATTLGRELPLPDGDVVLARSDIANADLPAILTQRGARVRAVVAYRTVAEISPVPAATRHAILRGAALVVAAPSAVRALRDALGADTLRHARFVAIGPRTAEAVRDLIGVEPITSHCTDTPCLADAVAPQRQEVTR